MFRPRRATYSLGWLKNAFPHSNRPASSSSGVPSILQIGDRPRRVSEEARRAYLESVLKAHAVIYDVCKETDLQYAASLSKEVNNHVYIKREDQQPVFSFKLRGAYNKIASLTEKEKRAGVVACSAGNHAQGVALSCDRLGIDNVIVMPTGTPAIKVNAVGEFGGNVKLFGDNYDEAYAEACRLRDVESRTMIHPFDDPLVIAGQGTVAMEVDKQLGGKTTDFLFACVGGGGLFAGTALYTKCVDVDTVCVGVEAEDAAGMTTSLFEGKVVTLDSVGLFADGASVRRIGDNTYDLISDYGDAMVTATTDEICAAIKAGFNDTRVVLEPAGALGIAGVRKYFKHNPHITNKNVVVVASGANVDFDRLRFVAERADLSERTVGIVAPEVPGTFFNLYMAIFPRNVTEFSYRAFDPKEAHILLSFQPKSENDYSQTVENIEKLNCEVHSYDDNDLALTHVRHLAGGRRPAAQRAASRERVFSFEFPERPGALKVFLDELLNSTALNVSLFHYRGHGSDVGRVLCGFSDVDVQQLNAFLSGLQFSFKEETENKAYKDFLN